MITVYDKEVGRKKSPYSKELSLFSKAELMFSAIAEGRSDRPGKAQDVTCSSCMQSKVCVTLLCCPPGEGDRS